MPRDVPLSPKLLQASYQHPEADESATLLTQYPDVLMATVAGFLLLGIGIGVSVEMPMVTPSQSAPSHEPMTRHRVLQVRPIADAQ